LLLSVLVWLFYAGDFSDTRLVWLDMNSRILANTRFPARQSRMIGIDRDSVAYFCGLSDCYALELGGEQPRWELNITDGSWISGGALVPGRLYLVSEAGYLYAFGEG
jgi:hypothetical protein